MADPSAATDPFDLQPDAFASIIRQLDTAVSAGHAFLDMGRGFPRLVVDDAAAAGFSPDEHARLPGLLNELPPLLFFAFEDVRGSALSDWLQGEEDEKPDEAELAAARERIELIRAHGPTLASIWRERTDSILPFLASVRHQVSGPATGTRWGLLEIIASRSPGRGLPSTPRDDILTISVLPSDIAYLLRMLERLQDELK